MCLKVEKEPSEQPLVSVDGVWIKILHSNTAKRWNPSLGLEV